MKENVFTREKKKKSKQAVDDIAQKLLWIKIMQMI